MLVQLLVGGLSHGKIIILRIFQDLMKLDFPTEILDKAVEVSGKRLKQEQANDLEKELCANLNKSTSLDL